MQALAAVRRALLQRTTAGGARGTPAALSCCRRTKTEIIFSNSESGGVEAFFEEGRGPDPQKAPPCGRSWRASELRIKSWDDLQKLWYVLYKEKNMLMSQLLMLKSQNVKMANRERIKKVKLSMTRIKHVLSERALAEDDRIRRNILKKLVNGR